MKYLVPVNYVGTANFIVEATSPEEAREQARLAFYNGEPEAMLGHESEKITSVEEPESYVDDEETPEEAALS